ncbi:MAG: ABC transporter permease [Cyclobacteriaceae bacterium]|nr:ABC transporter permease [Cyclobacteriaceae bacterium HetDA_MAG_MS6]
MIRNIFKVAIRNIFRNKVNSFINIFGLSLGITSFVLISFWVRDEITFDRYHKNIDGIFRVLEFQFYSDRIGTTSSTPGVLVPHLKENYPEVKYATRLTWTEETLFSVPEKNHFETCRYVDGDFLKIFSFDFVAGDKETALDDKYSVVLSEELASRYFGDQEAVGQTIKVRNDRSLRVTGVFKSWPKNCTYGDFDALLSIEEYIDRNEWAAEWGNNNLRTVVQLHDPTNYRVFDAKIKNIIREQKEDYEIDLWLQPFGETHLYSNYENGQQKGGRILYVRIFSIVAIFILLIACINFMNLATAQAVKRAKEVGLRKVVGAVKGNLMFQFLGESLTFALISGAMALAASFMLIPMFNTITDKQIIFDFDGFLLLILMGTILFTGLFSGSYPAFVISRYRPAEVLKGVVKSGKKANNLRKSLVVVQFSLSIIIIFSTIVISKQLQYVQDQDTGFDKSGLIYMSLRDDMDEKFDVIRTELLSNSSILNATATSFPPLRIGNSTWSVEWPGKSPEEKILFSNQSVDHQYVETMGLDLSAGRSFEAKYTTDTSNFLLNETAAKKMGFSPEEAVGQTITLWDRHVGKVVGVLKDFNFSSAHTEIRPMLLMHDLSWYNYLVVRADGSKLKEAINSLQTIQEKFASAYPFEYEFVDKDWAEFYETEQRTGQLFNAFAFISIVISCLGLFGLSAFAIQQRTKEIGVRKVLGASISSIIKLVSRDFALLVMIAAVIGSPIAWYFMDNWLSDFAFRIELSFLIPLLATFLVLMIAFLTIFYHSLKAARNNPVEALRYE